MGLVLQDLLGTSLPGPPRVDPTREAKIDHALSISGRVSNDVYDVRTIDCELIVATSGLPAVMNAIARRNFMTVLSASVRPADAFEAAKKWLSFMVSNRFRPCDSRLNRSGFVSGQRRRCLFNCGRRLGFKAIPRKRLQSRRPQRSMEHKDE